MPESFLKLHQSIFKGVTPFSWFIVSQLAQNPGIRSHDLLDVVRNGGPKTNLNNPIIDGFLRGDALVIKQEESLASLLDKVEKADPACAHHNS